jgi:hypothetical protein
MLTSDGPGYRDEFIEAKKFSVDFRPETAMPDDLSNQLFGPLYDILHMAIDDLLWGEAFEWINS